MSDAPRVLGVTWIDLGAAMLCLDCEVSFDLRAFTACPKCGRATIVPLATFLQERPAVDVSPYVDTKQLVPLGEVLHHAGNGLTPARVHAEFIVEAIDLRGRIGPHLDEELERRIARGGRRIVASVDDTLTRLRALAVPTTTKKELPDGATQDR